MAINRRLDKDVACTHTHTHTHTHTVTHTLEYYSVIKRNEILSFATTWMDLEGIVLNETSQNGQIPYDFIYTWDLKHRTNEQTKQNRYKLLGERTGICQKEGERRNR